MRAGTKKGPGSALPGPLGRKRQSSSTREGEGRLCESFLFLSELSLSVKSRQLDPKITTDPFPKVRSQDINSPADRRHQRHEHAPGSTQERAAVRTTPLSSSAKLLGSLRNGFLRVFTRGITPRKGQHGRKIAVQESGHIQAGHAQPGIPWSDMLPRGEYTLLCFR